MKALFKEVTKGLGRRMEENWEEKGYYNQTA